MMATHKIQFVAEGESLSTCRRFEEMAKSKKKSVLIKRGKLDQENALVIMILAFL